MPDTQYRTTLARMGAHPDADYYTLPSYWRGLADAAAEAQSAFWAASLAASNARAAEAWAAAEALDAAEMDTYATWQRLERIGADLLDGQPAPAAIPVGPRPVLTVVWLFLALAGLGLGTFAAFGIALARIAAAADVRHAFLTLDTAARRAERAPDGSGRPLSAAEIRARVTADQWFRADRLSVAGYGALCNLMYAGEDAYPYLSGDPSGTAVVWAHGRRWPIEEWNAAADREAAQLDAELLDAGGEDGRGGDAC